MFKKLRNRFLILNITLISVLLISSFSVVFVVVYKDTVNESDKILESTVRNLAFDELRTLSGDMPNIKRDLNRRTFSHIGELPREDVPPPDSDFSSDAKNIRSSLLTISVKIDENGGIIDPIIHSSYEYDEEFYNALIADAAKHYNQSSTKKEVSDTIKYDNVPWKYRIEAANINNSQSYYIAAINVETELNILKKLTVTLFLVLIITLAIIFLICLYFANKSIKPIKNAWDKQNRFIADASHELKTPLTTINTNIDVLLSTTNASDDQIKWLSYIKDETKRMTKLTHDLLRLASLEHDGSEIAQKEKISLTQIVRNSLLTMEAVMYENKITLTDDIKCDVYVLGNAPQLSQLVMILLDNAAKYTNQGGTVHVSLKTDDRHAYLSVKNSGKGISQSDAEKIFDRFYRVDESRMRSDGDSGGYGLGLSIAKSIANKHKGTITLSNTSKDFTEFTIKLMLLRKKRD